MNKTIETRRPLSLAIALALAAGSAHAATVVVTSTDDNTTANDGQCTLREAINVMKGSAISTTGCTSSGTFGTNDMIVFSTATPANSTISLDGTPLYASSLTSPLTIFGGGITIDAHQASYILQVANSTLTLDHVMLTGGSTTSGGGAGAISAAYSAVTMIGSTISNSYSTVAGGVSGIDSALTFDQCTLTGNSTIAGAAAVFLSGGKLVLSNSTVTGNTDTGLQGTGGITARYDIINKYKATLTLSNSILSGNSGPKKDLDASGAQSVNMHYSLLGSGLSSSYSGNGNVFSDDPKVGALADNGGLTKTMALLSGSPAIDTGSNALIPGGATYDQRGYPYPRVLNSTVDIGAFEFSDEIFADGFETPPL